MKKILKWLSIFCLSLLICVSGTNTIYAAPVSLNGPSSVRAGDSITLTLVVSHNGTVGIEGRLEYDKNLLELTKGPTAKQTGWKAEISDTLKFTAYDDEYAHPLSGNANVVTFIFKVKSSVPEGTNLKISVKEIIAATSSNTTELGAATYSVTVARPLSANANLENLSVTGSTLSPAFKPGTTSYNVGEVEYNVSKLDIVYKTEDENATVKITGNSLTVGNNTVTLTVTAENGIQKKYKISVTRKQDPNYVANSNANLKSLKVDKGILSPLFSQDITDYVVYLPYEMIGSSFTASGTESSSKAQGVTAGTIDSLIEGKNQTVVVCKAEDGTEKTYAITVVVMPKYEGVVPNIGGNAGGTDVPVIPDNPGNTEGPDDTEKPGDTENDTEPSVTPSEDDTDKKDEKPNVPTEDKPDNGGLVTILVILVVVVLVGALVYVLFFSKKR